MKPKEKVTVLIPCRNEEKGIAEVIKNFPRDILRNKGFELEVIVIDNNSTDRTAEVARLNGATVIFEENKGKGNTMRKGFQSIAQDTDYVVMLDGDDTYRSEEILKLLEPLREGLHDVAMGCRLSGTIRGGAMKDLNHKGNKLFSFLVRSFYRVPVTDVLTGYYAWKSKVIKELHPHLNSKGFSIEMEMVTKMARLGHKIISIPITYEMRLGESSLRPFHDGIHILKTFAINLFWRPNK
jgi:dolichol-phosphate hexosyltransferase